MRYISVVCALLLSVPSVFGQASQTKPEKPSLKETLQWMRNSIFAADVYINKEKRTYALTDFSGCQVHFTYTTSNLDTGKETYRIEEWFNLGDIDSAWIQLVNFGPDQKILTAPMRNDEEKLKARANGMEYTDKAVVFQMSADYADRFAKAFRYAVKLCGGKPSIF